MNEVLTEARGVADALLAAAAERQTLIQAGVLLLCLLLAVGLDRATSGPIEAEARRIKGAPRVLRIVSALRKRMRLAFFVALLAVVLLMNRAVLGQPLPVISVAFDLSLAYLVIAVASRIARSRLLARLVTLLASILAALSILGLLQPVAAALDDVAISLGQSRISALLVIKVLAILGLALWLASVSGHFAETRIQRSDELTPALRVLLGKFVRIALVVLALAVALGASGVDLTAFTVLSGAIGVGIGFGLQKVVSNFISGIIILVDRSIKPGDTISLGSTFGWIREMRARFVSVVTRDGKEYLIPNEDFITNQVINWSFTNDLVRLEIAFRAGYDSDPHEVMRIAREAAAGVPRVADDPPVACWMTGFGDFSLEYVLRFWIHDPQGGLANVRGTVLLALWDAFRTAGITIPLPQREVTLRGPVPSDAPFARPDPAATRVDREGSIERSRPDRP